MRQSKTFKLAVLILAVLVFSSVMLVSLNESNQADSSIVAQFPSFQLEALGEPDKSLSEQVLKREGYQLVNVWASWCGICASEHPKLVTLANQGVPIIGLNYRDSEKGALKYLAQHSNPYQEVIYDPQGRLAIDLGVIGTPETYLVDGQGNIVKKFSGKLTDKAWRKHFASYFTK